VDLAGVVHEEEEHMERPLLTAVVRGDLAMARLLRGLGASLDAPAPTGATPLSAAVCWEQREAAELLLELGADPNQVGGWALLVVGEDQVARAGRRRRRVLAGAAAAQACAGMTAAASSLASEG
jgi:hypothetical protein